MRDIDAVEQAGQGWIISTRGQVEGWMAQEGGT